MTTNEDKPGAKMINISDQPTGTIEATLGQNKRKRFGWPLLGVVLVVASGTIGFTATSFLLNLPKTPNCPQIFWPIASASMRLYCAQLEANRGTVDSFLRAINLVEALPNDHPLRTEINRNVQEWSVEILNLAEDQFQEGELETAIATAQKIPKDTNAYKLVQERIEHWRDIWSKGEEIFAEVEQNLRDSNWNLAFRSSVQLLNLDNKYWATTKYDEVVQKIQLAKEESTKLDAAYVVLRQGGLDNWLKAIEEAQKISSNSYAYQEAQNVIEKAKGKLFDYVQNLIDNRNWSQLQAITERIPENLAINEELEDWKALASAGMDSQADTVEGLQAAILSLEKIDSSSPLYEQSQELKSRWKQEVEDLTILTKAKDLSIAGTVDALKAAITQADLISSSNPRYQEAQQNIRQWNHKIQILEDQPVLDQARATAKQGDLASLQEAIAQASLIRSGRALYTEAQEEINQWRATIQRQEDQPLLDQAISLASLKDYQAAISTAEQVRQGRILYNEAQQKVRKWRREIRAQQDLQEAYTIADAKTQEAFVTAISLVRRIPSSTDVAAQSRQALDSWSYQLLSFANEKANQGLIKEAIQLARIIPSESSAFNTAQTQIELWQKLLIPVVPSPVIESPDQTMNSEQ